MFAGEIVPSRPTSPSNATMKLRKDWSSSHGAPVGSVHGSVPKKPSTRSPRQCMPPCVASPRSVCVVIGPFIGWNVVAGGSAGAAEGWLLIELEPSGSPRFQPRPSRSPKMWQLEHEASPLPDVPNAS